MKKILLFSAFFTAALLHAEVIRTVDMDFRGHLQGIAADETGIYCSFAHEMMKIDYTGKRVRRFTTHSHAGDMTTDGTKVYCAVTLWYKEPIEKYGASSCIFIYDKDLNLLEVKPFKTLRGFDGIAYLNGKFYVGLNDLGNKLRNENRIAVFDKNFALLKIAAVTIGKPTKFGAQTINRFNGKLLAGFYGGGENSFIFDPAELETSDTTVKPIGTLPVNVTVGFTELPPRVASPGTFIEARNSRKKDPVSGKKKYGAKFFIKCQAADGKLKPASLLLNKKTTNSVFPLD